MNELKAYKLSKSFKGKNVVKSVSLSVREGQVVGLLGPNGAGKTTSFYIVAGLLPSDSGEVFINDQRVDHLLLSERAQRGLGYLPQEASIFRKMTVKENIEVGLESMRLLGKQEIQKRVDEVLEEFQLGHIAESLGYTLSGGERRRVEIARALVRNPHFLLLDEPFAGIDPISISELQKTILNLKTRELGILITDHNVRETLKICDYAYLLRDGEVLVEGTPQTVVESSVAVKFYLGKNFKL